MAARENELIDRTDRVFLEVMARIRTLVGELPEGILREQAWRDILPQVQLALEPYQDVFSAELFTEITDMTPEVLEEAERLVKAVTAAPLATVRTAGTLEAILNTRVGAKRLEELFSVSGEQTVSAFVRDHLSIIDRTVKTGILEGLTTPEIADQIAVTYARAGKEYISTRSTSSRNAARAIRANSQAIARTAIQDANRQIKDAFYDVNRDRLTGLRWEWVALLDSRTCPRCAPLDGETYASRKAAPTWPLHIRCRCQLVIIDPDDEARLRSGLIVSNERMTGPRSYKTKVKVKGQKLYRKAIDIKPRADGKAANYADYLAQTNVKSQQMFFGGGNAGSIRANKFRERLKQGDTPDDALTFLINTDKKGVKRFKPAASL